MSSPTHRTIRPADQSTQENYHLLTSLVVPRPIAWISTRSEDGVDNLAPYSFFNVVSSDPLLVHFTQSRRLGDPWKDTFRNVMATGEFVINISSATLAEHVAQTAAVLPPGENEFAWAHLETAASTAVAPPRVAAAPAALECRLDSVLAKGNGTMVFGAVQCFHVAETVWNSDRVDPRLLDPLCRLSGANFAAMGDVFRLPTPSWDEVRAGAWPRRQDLGPTAHSDTDGR